MASQKLWLSLALFLTLLAMSSAFPDPYHPYPRHGGNYRHRSRYGYRNNPRHYFPENPVPSESEEYFYPGEEYTPSQEEEVPAPKEEEEYTPSEEKEVPAPREEEEYSPSRENEEPAPKEEEEYVEAHNKARSEAGVGPVKWDRSLARHAMDHASRLAHSGCDLFHFGGPFGENLAMSGGKLRPSEAVEMWMEEKSNYKYGYGVTGHYTQIMWAHTNSLGCAKATCDNNAGEIVSCLYFPPGNVVGEKPY